MKIAIWTKSPPKVNAIEEAIENCKYFEWENIEFTTLKVDSWISDMPTSLEENMKWAENRAKNSKKEIKADLYIWMEWWMHILGEKAYLFWVVYVLDNNWEWHYGFSNMMEVPKLFKHRIYENNQELWPVLTELSWEQWASQKNWAFGHWSDNLLTRKDQFMFAFLSAIPPFYNKYYKLK